MTMEVEVEANKSPQFFNSMTIVMTLMSLSLLLLLMMTMDGEW